jgi:hypothetical protein
MSRQPRDRTTSAAPLDHVLAAVVGSYAQSRGLTAHGIPATTYDAILGEAPETVAGYFDAEPAQLYARPADARRAEAVAEKLTGIGVPVRVIRIDRSDLP